MKTSLFGTVAALALWPALAAAGKATPATPAVAETQQVVCVGVCVTTVPAAEPQRLPVELSTPAVSKQTFVTPVVAQQKFVRPLPGPDRRFWFGVEESFIKFSKGPLPPTVVSITPVVAGPSVIGPTFLPTAPGFFGLESFQGTQLVFPGQPLNPTTDIDTRTHFGQTYRAGYWLDPAHTSAVEGDFLYVESKTTSLFATSPGATNFGFPFADPATGQPYVIAQSPTTITNTTFINTTPGVFVRLFGETIANSAAGGVNAFSSSNLFNSQINYRTRGWSWGGNGTLDLTAGMRFAGLHEEITINSSTTRGTTDTILFEPALGLPTGAIPIVGTTTTVESRTATFGARNFFVGPQVGIGGKYHWGAWWISGDAHLALGATLENVSRTGTTFTAFGTSSTPTTGIFLAGIPLNVATGPGAAPVTTTTSTVTANGLFGPVGSARRTVFAVVPDGVVRVGYDVIPDLLSLTTAYSAFYISAVARPGNLIGTFNVSDVQQSGFWAQAVNVGAQLKF